MTAQVKLVGFARSRPPDYCFDAAGIHHFTFAMARSLLVALALAPAAHALGVPDPKGDCPCEAFFDSDLTIEVPKGQCDDNFEVVPCTGFYTCDLAGWSFISVKPSCFSKEDCDLVGGTYKEAVGDQCCGLCWDL